MNEIPRLLYGLIIVTALGLTMACSDDDDDNGGSQQGAESAICGDLDALETAVDQVSNLNSSSSVSQISTALASVKTAGSDLRESIQDAKTDDYTPVQDALSKLDSTLTSVITSSSISEAQAELTTARNNVQSSVADAKSRAKCGNVTPAATPRATSTPTS